MLATSYNSVFKTALAQQLIIEGEARGTAEEKGGCVPFSKCCGREGFRGQKLCRNGCRHAMTWISLIGGSLALQLSLVSAIALRQKMIRVGAMKLLHGGRDENDVTWEKYLSLLMALFF
ncbi:hypothetical protein [Pajaroellobacter abortibovis]|nr:hypothetical protein [Pajaroellobacter abortibovis]